MLGGQNHTKVIHVSKARVVVIVGAIAYAVGFVVSPPPEKEDGNQLMRVLWPVVACIQLVERGFVKG
jgi:hypothetical protein